MPSPVADLLADLAVALRERGVPWYLFGARAAILHGAARLTADVDITVMLPQGESAGALVSTLTTHGFAPRLGDEQFLARTRVAPFAHLATGVPLDIVLGGPGLEEQFLARAVQLDVEGTTVPVASVEDIVVMKVLAGRAKDLEDAQTLVAVHRRSLDRSYIRATLTALEDALGQSDLVPVFESWIAPRA